MAQRTILHCDCNSYFASVECIDHPELREVPMAVCGDPESRHGIILAKNQKAKKANLQVAGSSKLVLTGKAEFQEVKGDKNADHLPSGNVFAQEEGRGKR